MVAGHKRKFAAALAELTEIPYIVRNLTDDEATIIMVDSNLQRETIFAEIEDEAIADFQKTDEAYAALYQQISKLKADNPFIGKVIDGSGDISLTAEEHEVLTEYFRLRFRLDDMERQRLYFRGHTDCISYLKKIGALN